MRIPLTFRGDGIQVRHIPIILRYIAHEDQKSRNKGSVKVCTIWGFEEPENGLELLKAFKFADEFEDYASEIQIFVSTHSPAFYMKKESSGSRIFFVSKKPDSDETRITNAKGNHSIAENMGLMPLVAPFIEEQSIRLRAAETIYQKNILTDVPTILVEGETDVSYLKIAIKEHSPKLNELIHTNKLRIVCKNDGAGTTVLSDWALAWIYSGFKSKMYVLFDKDEAGEAAKQSIENNEVFRHKQNSVSVKLRFIKPSDEIIKLYQLDVNVGFEIEHLLSIDFWKEMKRLNYSEQRSDGELLLMFNKQMQRNKTLDAVIEELIDDDDLRDTILLHKPKSLKKKKIVELLARRNDKKSDTIGFLKTIEEMEAYFCE